MKNKLIITGGILGVVLLSFIGLSSAQSTPSVGCKSMGVATGIIEGLNKQRVIFRGISARGHVTIIHLNKDTGTWSANVVLPTNVNMLCNVDAGTTGELLDTSIILNKPEKGKRW
jgi:hypothetical protein